ncbi:phage tail protein [Bacillus sp. PAMC26568]|nr:phage tail protein [Bacillus sp. PAMC26568]
MGVTVGLEKIHVAKLLTDTDTAATYEVPEKLAEALTATITRNSTTNTLYADNKASETVTKTGSTTVEIGIDQLSTEMEALLLGHTVNADGVIVKNKDDVAPYVALGFSGTQSDGKEKLIWLFKGKFQPPASNYTTQGENIEFQTPTLSGTFINRDFDGLSEASVNTGDAGVNAAVVTGWFTEVYEEPVTP